MLVIKFVWVDDVELRRQAPANDLVEISVEDDVLRHGDIVVKANLELFALLFDGEKLFDFTVFVLSELYTENARSYRRQR